MRELGELAFVGAGLGGGFTNTNELRVMKYDEAMAGPDRDKWIEAVKDEYENLRHYKVFEPVSKDDLPKDAKILTSTWAMKKKASGRYKARLNARGFEQVDGVHYDSNDKSAPVAGNMTVLIMLVLMIMSNFWAELLDVKGAFLNGRFAEGEHLYMYVPQGFEEFYPKNVVLLMLRTLYGLKQAAIAFWKETQLAFKSMSYQRSKADPCLHIRWTDGGLVAWLSWVDDYLVIGPKHEVKKAKADMMDRFDCDEVGELREYVGCKTDYDAKGGRLKFTQPVMLQSFVDEFEMPDGQIPTTPAVPGSILMPVVERNQLSKKEQTKYRSGVGKLLHMMRWSRPDILNAVRELSKFMSGASEAHMVAMKRVMKYCVATPYRGLELKPTRKWNGVDKDFLFRIRGLSDSEYAKDPSRKSINGWAVFLEDAPVSIKSKMMPIVALSVTEAELFAAVQCAQDMMHAMRIIESIGLQVEKPMKLFVDNKGAVDITHNWSVGGRTRHIEVKQYFLRQLKESRLK